MAQCAEPLVNVPTASVIQVKLPQGTNFEHNWWDIPCLQGPFRGRLDSFFGVCTAGCSGIAREAKGVERGIESFQLGEVCEGGGKSGEAVERDIQELQGCDRCKLGGERGQVVARNAQLAEGSHVADTRWKLPAVHSSASCLVSDVQRWGQKSVVGAPFFSPKY